MKARVVTWPTHDDRSELALWQTATDRLEREILVQHVASTLTHFPALLTPCRECSFMVMQALGQTRQVA